MMRPRLLIVAMFVLFSIRASVGWAAQPLEGTKWKIKLVPDDDSRKAGAKEIEDAISFKGNKFTSDTFAKQGFSSVEYEEDTRGVISATFKVEAKSDSAGTAKWSGTTTSDQIRGQLIVVAKDGKQTTYNFQGEKQR
jgi:hypothetical protein